MKRTSAAVIILLTGIGFAGCTRPQTPAVPPATVADRVQVRSGGRIVAVPIEEYVLATTLAEVSPVDQSATTTEKIFEIQAIVARTYAASQIGRHRADGFDLCDTTHCQVYEPNRIRTSRFTAAAREAVQRTAGTILTYGQRPAEAMFHADCGGYTATPETVWGGRHLPYLVAEPDKLPSDPHRKWRVSVTTDKLRAALNENSATAVGRKLDDVRVTARDASGRVTRIIVSGEYSRTLRGEQFRAALNAALGTRTIQSTKLTVTRNSSTYVFDGSGFGHGVGLCQVGAAARAKRGDDVEEILEHYFPGVRLSR
jgi:stage II sporulation protein D